MPWPADKPADPPGAPPLPFDERFRCNSVSKRNKPYRCRARASAGGVCYIHGGRIPRVVAAEKRRRAEAQAVSDLEAARARFGVAVDVDPHEAVAEILGVTMGTERILRGMVDELRRGGTITDEGKVVAGIYGPDHLGDGRPHVLWSMWRDASADVARFSKVAADMGFAERQQARADRQADFIEGVVTELLKEFGIDVEDPEVGAKVGKVLTLAARAA